ncbi:hypothetical protein [Streptomyces sp. CC228A]|nr:hypothetical protein [Streptomyces sp. CC228A]
MAAARSRGQSHSGRTTRALLRVAGAAVHDAYRANSLTMRPHTTLNG